MAASRVLVYWLTLVFAGQIWADTKVIRVGVAPGLTEGMHAKLYRHISKALDLPVEILEVPLKRRLRLLEQGRLDLTVGLMKTAERTVKLTYIEPEYTERQSEDRLFLLTQRLTELEQGRLIQGKAIATLRGSTIYRNFESIKHSQLFETISLEQAIHLLQKQRVDYLLYAQDPAHKKLSELDLHGIITESELMPSKVSVKKVYMVISRHSFLTEYQNELQQVASALKKGKYDALHQQHFNSVN